VSTRSTVRLRALNIDQIILNYRKVAVLQSYKRSVHELFLDLKKAMIYDDVVLLGCDTVWTRR
jgi:hypothetical protein